LQKSFLEQLIMGIKVKGMKNAKEIKIKP